MSNEYLTVGELIDKLLDYPLSLKVVDGGFNPISSVEITSVERKDGCEEVVQII